MSGKVMVVVTGLAIGAGVPVSAQSVRDREVTRERRPNAAREAADQLRYQIGTMERVLENAVEHGASVWRDRLQAIAPVQAMLLDNARVRGYRLDGYGLFFDIDVPSLETTLFSAFRTLDQNGLGVQSALNQLKTYIQAQAANDGNLQQALKRIELQVGPTAAATSTAEISASSAGGAAVVQGAPPAADANDPILTNPEEVFRAEVMEAIVDALLDYSARLGIGPEEWLTVGVRRNEVRPRIGLETNAPTVIARVRGSDLVAFRAGQLSRDEAIKRVVVQVF